MKTMTCKQMGGPCDFAFHGNTADEVIKAEDKHLREMVAQGDETHKSALKSMQDRWKNPISGMGWYSKTKKAFAALPEEK
jgi:predicted small metal-binding protein